MNEGSALPAPLSGRAGVGGAPDDLHADAVGVFRADGGDSLSVVPLDLPWDEMPDTPGSRERRVHHSKSGRNVALHQRRRSI
jgi:hypothetical protein